MIPTTTMVTIKTIAKTGRFTQTLASHCIAPSLHLRAVAHVGRQLGDDLLAGLHAADDRNLAVAWLARLHQPILQPPARRHEHVLERALGAHRLGGHRRQRLLPPRGPRVPAHARTQPVRLVGETRLDDGVAALAPHRRPNVADLAVIDLFAPAPSRRPEVDLHPRFYEGNVRLGNRNLD